jgi:hypothetical protein
MFYADRGIVLARIGRGERTSELAAELSRTIAKGEAMERTLAVAALRRAEAALLN